MKTYHLLSLCFVLLHAAPAFSQPDTSATFADFIKTQKNQPDSARFAHLNDFAYDMTDRLKFVDAEMAATEMMQLATTTKNETWKGRTFMTMAHLEKVQLHKTQAVANYQQAQVIFHTAGEFRREIRALQRIAGIYISTHDLKLAEQYLQRALKLAQAQNLEDERAFLYTDFASVEDIKRNFLKALSYNSEAIEILKKLKIDYSATLFNRGIILKNAGRYQQSIDTYKECLEYAEKHDDKELELMTYVSLPNTLLLMNRLDEAEEYARKALEMAKGTPQQLTINVEAYETLTKIHQKRGEFEKAFDAQKKWVIFRDSVFNVEKSRQLIETEAKFQTREKQQQIQELDEENLRKKQQLVWLYGGMSLLALLLGVTLWQYRVIRRGNVQLEKANHTLSEANQRVQIQSAQLKELMQELHHRVKNNLAIVSSLLSLQADRLDDEKAAKAVMEGQQRVEAMSLIHNQLYQTENVTGVSMEEYIGDLARGLMQSFRYKDNFDLRLNIQPIVVDVELAVPLGLILNELVTNAFKHAYHDVSDPELSIRLWQDTHLYLEVKDNGPGVSPEKWNSTSSSFGKRLIHSLTKQARGKLEVRTDNGFCFLLTFPAVKAVIPESAFV